MQPLKAFLRESIELEKGLYRLDTQGQDTLSTFDAFIKVLGKLPGHLKNYISANPLKSFTAIAIALGVAMGKIADRVYNAEKYAKKALDKSTEKVNEVKSEIESLNSELQTTQSRIDELNAKENLTLVEQEELERLKETNAELERELRIKQSILSEEQKDANKDAKKYFTTKKDSLEFESSYEGVEIHEKTDYIGTVEERIEKLQQYADGQIKLSEETIEAYKDYIESTLSDFMEEDDYLVEGQDDGILARLDALYEKYDLYANGKASVTEKKIKDILAKADFQDASKQLEELGKSGELSIATLSSHFPELIEYLDKAGISANELYRYIMALSNPDAINYDNVRKQLIQSLGFGDTIDNANEAQLWNEISSLGEEELVLEAYLKVRDQYGEHPEGWNAKDWIANIQSELEAEELEVNISFDQAWVDSYTSESDAVKELADNLLELAEQGRLTKETFNEADSTDYFKNLGISADEAISKINKLVDESSQLSSMASHISSISDALSTKQEDGFVSADTLSGFDVEVRGLESWDRFQEVLGSTTSSYEECQEAANALATEWVNSSNFLAQLTEENKEYYETQLQAMGVENYKEVITCAQELNTAKEALEQASFDVATATNEEIQSFINEGAYSELAQQQIWNLVLAKQTEEGITLDTSADCQNLLSLAQNAGVTGSAIELLTQLLEIYNNLAASTYGTNAQVINAVKNKAETLKNQINDIFANGASNDAVELDPRIKVSPSAKSAGKETGDAYKEGLEEALSDLDSVISGITSKIGDQITTINEQKSAALDTLDEEKEALEEAKDAAIEALEAQRDAELEAIEAQKDAINERIKVLDKQIKSKQDEIDAINDAADARKRELDLQKAQYELERMQNQRTMLVNYMPDTIVI